MTKGPWLCLIDGEISDHVVHTFEERRRLSRIGEATNISCEFVDLPIALNLIKRIASINIDRATALTMGDGFIQMIQDARFATQDKK